MNQSRLHFPSPEELWGDFTVDTWNQSQQGWFNTWLSAVSSMILYSKQETMDRVSTVVKTVIAKAKSGEMSYEDSILNIMPNYIFSELEIAEIKEEIKVHGKTIGDFFMNKHRRVLN